MYLYPRRTRLAASIAGGIAAILSMHSAAADEEIVVYGKRLAIVVEIDRAALHIDLVQSRAALSDEIRAALAALESREPTGPEVEVATVKVRSGG